jgi:hypothetical protein
VCLASNGDKQQSKPPSDDSNFDSMYKPVHWSGAKEEIEDNTRESDLPSGARLNRDLPSAEEAAKLAESWGTEAPGSEDE